MPSLAPAASYRCSPLLALQSHEALRPRERPVGELPASINRCGSLTIRNPPPLRMQPPPSLAPPVPRAGRRCPENHCEGPTTEAAIPAAVDLLLSDDLELLCSSFMCADDAPSPGILFP